MSLETDLTGEQEPEERMELHEQVADTDQTNEKPSESEHDGQVETEDFDISEAVSGL